MEWRGYSVCTVRSSAKGEANLTERREKKEKCPERKPGNGGRGLYIGTRRRFSFIVGLHRGSASFG